MPSIDPSPSMLERVFGTDKERFVKGIKKRRLTRESGMPEDIEKKMFEGMPVMGMTKYLKPGGGIDKSGREFATNIYKRAMKGMGMESVGNEFAKRYPRIAAHINPYLLETSQSARGEGVTHVGQAFSEPYKTALVGLDKNARNLRNTMSHEGTHVAQRLGMGKRMVPAYEAAEELVGYEMNPLEQSARQTARRYGLGRDIKPFKTRQALEAVGEMAEEGNSSRDKLIQALQRKR